MDNLAVCALILNEKGEFLAVSRKDNPNDFGLPGGKVDWPEEPQLALVREVKEETGLNVSSLLPFFEDKDGKYFVTTYLVEVTGDIRNIQLDPKETGVVKFLNREDLIDVKNSFGEYNTKMFEAYDQFMAAKHLRVINLKEIVFNELYDYESVCFINGYKQAIEDIRLCFSKSLVPFVEDAFEEGFAARNRRTRDDYDNRTFDLKNFKVTKGYE